MYVFLKCDLKSFILLVIKKKTTLRYINLRVTTTLIFIIINTWLKKIQIFI